MQKEYKRLLFLYIFMKWDFSLWNDPKGTGWRRAIRAITWKSERYHSCLSLTWEKNYSFRFSKMQLKKQGRKKQRDARRVCKAKWMKVWVQPWNYAGFCDHTSPLTGFILKTTHSQKNIILMLYLITFSNVVSCFSFLKQPLPVTEELLFQKRNREILICSLKIGSLSKNICTEKIVLFWKKSIAKLRSCNLIFYSLDCDTALSWFLITTVSENYF